MGQGVLSFSERSLRSDSVCKFVMAKILSSKMISDRTVLAVDGVAVIYFYGKATCDYNTNTFTRFSVSVAS